MTYSKFNASWPDTNGGTLIPGAALEQIEQELVDLSLQVPVFETLAEVQAFEAAFPGRRAMYYPAPWTYADDFETPVANIIGGTTQIGGATYIKGAVAAVGDYPMQTTSGWAVNSSGTGSSVVVATPDLDFVLTVAYPTLSAGQQIRLIARGVPSYTTADRSVMPVQVVFRGDGLILWEPYYNGSSWVQRTIVSSFPLSGTAQLRVKGNEVKIFVNGAQYGATEILDPKQQVGQFAGFSVYGGGKALSWDVSSL